MYKRNEKTHCVLKHEAFFFRIPISNILKTLFAKGESWKIASGVARPLWVTIKRPKLARFKSWSRFFPIRIQQENSAC